MKRREMLKFLSAAAATVPAMSLKAEAAAAPRAKITDIKIAKVKEVAHLGTYHNAFHTPDFPTPISIGNFEVTEVYTDQGAIGVGPGTTPQVLRLAKEYLVGKDPFDVADHARYLNVQGRPGVQIEIALWDLCGKLANQPLYKLWGGGKDRVMPYGATLGIGQGPEERARVAAKVKASGFKAVKMRASFPTMKEDIQMMTLVRKAIGDDTLLLVDANKAGPYGGAFLTTIWDYQRAYETAMEFQRLGTWWLEEPLGRFDYDGLAELNKACGTMRLAGGEACTRIDEYRDYMTHRCYDILNCDVVLLGPTLHRQATALAFAFGQRVVPHASGVMTTLCHMHLAAAHPQPVWGRLDKDGPHLEVDHNPTDDDPKMPGNDFFKINSIFTTPVKLDGEGYLPMPTEPGLGFTIQPDLMIRS